MLQKFITLILVLNIKRTHMKNSHKQILKFILDFLPLILFFLSYKVSPPGLKPAVFASLVLTIATAISMLISKLAKIKLEKFAIYSNLGVIVFGMLTVFFDNPVFIKAKLSIINFIFGVLLLFFYLKRKPIIKNLFKDKIEMDDEKWNILNLRFALMFFCVAALNIYFWHFTAENTWVNFKTFGVLPFTIIFMIFQMRFIIKNGHQIS
jgi:intracellular septation protein